MSMADQSTLPTSASDMVRQVVAAVRGGRPRTRGSSAGWSDDEYAWLRIIDAIGSVASGAECWDDLTARMTEDELDFLSEVAHRLAELLGRIQNSDIDIYPEEKEPRMPETGPPAYTNHHYIKSEAMREAQLKRERVVQRARAEQGLKDQRAARDYAWSQIDPAYERLELAEKALVALTALPKDATHDLVAARRQVRQQWLDAITAVESLTATAIANDIGVKLSKAALNSVLV